jgi:pyruvate formate lyase activating enzyme
VTDAEHDPSGTGVPLVASPYDLRVSLGDHVGESTTKAALQSGDLGFVHSFTTGSAVDGPGMRVVVWLTGCHFRCVFCHNPDTWKVNNGIPVPLARAIEEVRKYRRALSTMKGGLTVSGGEPLLQDRFVIKLFTAMQQSKIHTTLDTNGYLGERLSDADLLTCDLIMLGMKALDPNLHRRITGMDNETVLAFARRLAALRRPMWLRYVLVPGLSDDPGEIARIAEFAASLGNVEQVELLPFHQLGRFKWERLGTPYELQDTKPPPPPQVDQALAAFRAAGLVVH